jgi:hypothetical protein
LDGEENTSGVLPNIKSPAFEGEEILLDSVEITEKADLGLERGVILEC